MRLTAQKHRIKPHNSSYLLLVKHQQSRLQLRKKGHKSVKFCCLFTAVTVTLKRNIATSESKICSFLQKEKKHGFGDFKFCEMYL